MPAEMKALRCFLSSQYLNLLCTVLLCTIFAAPLGSCGGSSGESANESGANQSETTQYRTIDGSGNNLGSPQMNKAGTQFVRLAPPAYADGKSSLAGSHRPNPRNISNTVHSQKELITNPDSTTNFMWLWGQFIDHDVTFTDDNRNDPANIKIPEGDEIFDPHGTGTAEIFFNRSFHDPDTGTEGNPRQQLNAVTGWIDASTVYGSERKRADALRTYDGTGKLKTSGNRGNFLPYNEGQFSNSRFHFATFFLAGDERANENIGILSIQTLFMREHNRLAEEIAMNNPGLSGEEIYQRTRRIVGAQIQAITYNEFLPRLLGPNALRPYSGYDGSINSGIANVFTSAAFRVGHTFLGPKIPFVDAQCNETHAVALKDAFFKTEIVVKEGIDPILRGFATSKHQRVDALIIDDVRNFLFVDDVILTGTPPIEGLDLVTLNIHRGRDHGLPSYNDMREELGLLRKESFSDITSDTVIERRLREAYGTNKDGMDNTDNIDIWVGGIVEDRYGKSMLGELFHTIISRQFRVLRDGDRFWYQRILSPEELREVEETKLADIIRRNTAIGDEIGDDVFVVLPSECVIE